MKKRIPLPEHARNRLEARPPEPPIERTSSCKALGRYVDLGVPGARHFAVCTGDLHRQLADTATNDRVTPARAGARGQCRITLHTAQLDECPLPAEARARTTSWQADELGLDRMQALRTSSCLGIGAANMGCCL